MPKPLEPLPMKDQSIRAVDGQSLLAESCRMLEYLRDRARTLTAGDILERTRAAALPWEMAHCRRG